MSVIRIASLYQIYNDGNHNAFTDLCRFGEYYYLTFRSCPEGHMIFASSLVAILRSRNAQQWEKVYTFWWKRWSYPAAATLPTPALSKLRPIVACSLTTPAKKAAGRVWRRVIFI